MVFVESAVQKAALSCFMNSRLTIAVTGGVACGKSAFCRRFAEKAPLGTVELFSCDESVKDLLQVEGVRGEIEDLGSKWGVSLVREESLDRVVFRELLFENSEFRGKVEELLHPLVLRRVVDHAAGLSNQVRIFLVEVPLLYEVGFPIKRELDLAVVSSETVQIRRLNEDRGLEVALARRILRSQIPNEEKIKRADILVWNDGSREVLDAQTDHLLSRCDTLLNP